MIRFLSIDIDGCLNHGTNTKPNRRKLQEIRDILAFKKDQFSFSLNSGRDVKYVRRYAQLLSCNSPLVCENGGILYYPSTDNIKVHPRITPNYIDEICTLEKSITNDISQMYPGYILEKGKLTMISLNPPTGIPITNFYTDISSYIAYNFDAFAVTRSASAVDISLKNINKNEGLRIILADFKVKYSEVCAIGDSINDLVVLKQVRYPACPKNADDQVKTISKYIATKDYEDGVLEILSRI